MKITEAKSIHSLIVGEATTVPRLITNGSLGRKRTEV